MVRPIVTIPKEVLRRPTTRVKNPTAPEIQSLIQDLKDTVRAAPGVGLAANQIGDTRRVCVINYPQENGPYGLINPEIVSSAKGTSVLEEGCLSVPGTHVRVARPKKVVVRALDESGKPVDIRATDFLAKVLQHEIDHLNGKLITDYLPRQ